MTSMAKRLGEAGLNVARSLQKNRTEFYLQHALVMYDLDCPGSAGFLKKASDEGYFKSPYRWLLLDLGNSHSMNEFEELEMVVDSDVVVLRKIGDEYQFIETYKVSTNSEVIQTHRATWRPLKYDSRNSTSKQNTSNSIEEDKVTNVDTSSSIQEVKINTNTPSTITVDKYGVIEDYRRTKVLSTRRRDLRRHTLTMVNVITDSNDTRKHLDDRLQLHQDSITKMSYSVVRICFEMLNASEELTFTHTWGYRDKNGNWQGIVDDLIKKKADLGTLTIFTQERMEVVDYIAMVGSTAVRFVFREPPLSYISNIFTLPFTAAVWWAIVVCVLGCSVFLYITSKWEASMSMHQFQLDGSWADVIILIIGAVLQQGCTLEPRYAAGRGVTLLLFLALTILYAAYSANIVVLLRAPSSSVRSLPDLLNSPLKLGASDFEYNRYFFKKLKDPIRKAIYDKKIAPKGKKPNYYSMEEGVEKIRRGLFAFHMELNPGYRLIQETYREDEKCDLVEIDYINEIDPWVPGQKRSPFKDLFKINFIKIRESGIQSCIHHRLHVPRPRCSGTVATFSSVGVADMYPALLATLYGMLLAPAVLMLEIVYHRLTELRAKSKKRRCISKLQRRN
ncbi:ionotropic receptor 75a-like [Ostrinia furnacalis]|uniref:ionotropic receptor 75a-like n=1 Tax=Ostrinia furnacalis TaxID=93504 RepID=UPI0010398BF4|nr:ionotropic receptor 75a-like [Ostrinia furnacalis]